MLLKSLFSNTALLRCERTEEQTVFSIFDTQNGRGGSTLERWSPEKAGLLKEGHGHVWNVSKNLLQQHTTLKYVDIGLLTLKFVLSSSSCHRTTLYHRSPKIQNAKETTKWIDSSYGFR